MSLITAFSSPASIRHVTFPSAFAVSEDRYQSEQADYEMTVWSRPAQLLLPLPLGRTLWAQFAAVSGIIDSAVRHNSTALEICNRQRVTGPSSLDTRRLFSSGTQLQ